MTPLNALSPFIEFFNFFLSLFTFLPSPLGPFVASVISLVMAIFLINLFLALIGVFFK